MLTEAMCTFGSNFGNPTEHHAHFQKGVANCAIGLGFTITWAFSLLNMLRGTPGWTRVMWLCFATVNRESWPPNARPSYTNFLHSSQYQPSLSPLSREGPTSGAGGGGGTKLAPPVAMVRAVLEAGALAEEEALEGSQALPTASEGSLDVEEEAREGSQPPASPSPAPEDARTEVARSAGAGFDREV